MGITTKYNLTLINNKIAQLNRSYDLKIYKNVKSLGRWWEWFFKYGTPRKLDLH